MHEIVSTDECSPAQAARILGVTPQRVKQLCNAGTLPCRRTPLGRLILRAAVERLRRERESA